MMTVLAPAVINVPGTQMLQPTTLPAQIVVDTIIRTVDLGMCMVDATVADETTVLRCGLLADRPGCCLRCGIAWDLPGQHRAPRQRWAGRRVSLQLRLWVPRYECCHDGCARAVMAHDTRRLARPGASTARRCEWFILRRLMLDRATADAVACELGRFWDTVRHRRGATTALLITARPARLDGVGVIGVDEHKWAHTRRAQADWFVTVITDLAAVVAVTGPADSYTWSPAARRPR